MSCLAGPWLLPAQASSSHLCPPLRPPISTLARAKRRPSQGAPGPSPLACGSRPRTPCPGRGQPGQLQLLLLGGAPPSSAQRRVSTPEGRSLGTLTTNPEPPPPLCLSQKSEKASPVLGKWLWGAGPSTPVTPGWGWGSCCPASGRSAPGPSHSGQGRFSRSFPFPHSFLHALHTPRPS